MKFLLEEINSHKEYNFKGPETIYAHIVRSCSHHCAINNLEAFGGKEVSSAQFYLNYSCSHNILSGKKLLTQVERGTNM